MFSNRKLVSPIILELGIEMELYREHLQFTSLWQVSVHLIHFQFAGFSSSLYLSTFLFIFILYYYFEAEDNTYFINNISLKASRRSINWTGRFYTKDAVDSLTRKCRHLNRVNGIMKQLSSSLNACSQKRNKVKKKLKTKRLTQIPKPPNSTIFFEK